MSGITSSKAVWPEDTWPLRPVIRSLINCWVTRDHNSHQHGSRTNPWSSEGSIWLLRNAILFLRIPMKLLLRSDRMGLGPIPFSSYRWTEWISHLDITVVCVEHHRPVASIVCMFLLGLNGNLGAFAPSVSCSITGHTCTQHLPRSIWRYNSNPAQESMLWRQWELY